MWTELAKSIGLVAESTRNITYIVSDHIFQIILILAIVLSSVYYLLSIGMVFHKKKDEIVLYEKDLPFVTVQIPTYNELAAIECARRCLEFDYPKDKYDIIIGDDSNKKEVSSIINEFAKEYDNVRVIKRASNVGYKPGNLNNMLKHTNGEIIVIFDSDFLPEKDFMRKIIAPFSTDKKICAVQARWDFIKPYTNLVSTLSSTVLAVVHHIVLPFINKNAKISFLCGSAEAVKKDVLISLGGWQTGSLTEDIEYSLRALKKGYKIKYLEDLKCECEVPYTPKDMYKQQMRWAYGVVRAYLDHAWEIAKTGTLTLKEKFAISFACSGYMFSFMLLCLFMAGAISFITHPSEPINIGKFFFTLGRNVILTSGFLFAGVIALSKINARSKSLRMIVSSFSFGIITTYFVNVGIIKAILKKPMKWYMLNKVGNQIAVAEKGI